MKRVNFICFFLLASFVSYNILLSQEKIKTFDLTLSSIEALAENENEWGCGGNPTWVPNHYLGSANCWNGATHKKCKSMNGVCCNPSEQTDCDKLY